MPPNIDECGDAGEEGGPRRIRMLLVAADKYPPFRVDVKVLFAGLLGRGPLSIDWILQSADPCHRSYVARLEGGRVFVGRTNLNEGRLGRLHKHTLGLLNDLRALRLLLTMKYDCVQVKDKFVVGAILAVFARLLGVRFFFWLSWPFPEEYLWRARTGTARYPILYRIRGGLAHLLLYRIVLPRADHVFAQSEQMRADLAAQGIGIDRITVVPMGVFPAEFAALAEHPAGRPAEIVHLGSLSRERRLDFLIRVLARVRQAHPQARLVFVGGGEADERRLLLDEAARLGVEGAVEIVGLLDRPAALARTACAAVCVSPFFPSPILRSTSPTKLVEYMALGRPVVANDHPEQRIVLEQSGGGICTGYDEEEFAQAVSQLLAHPEQAEEMGRRGRRYVESVRDYARIAERVAARYRAVCFGGDSPGASA